MKLSEKVFILVKDYFKVGICIKIVIGVDLDISLFLGNVIIWYSFILKVNYIFY